MKTDKAVFGGGCFWCLEPVFKELRGVLRVEPGYAGGHVINPTYEQVCTGTTGHAEVVQVEYDPAVIAYRELLEVFFSVHDPTTLNRQGADIGPQYRSVIFYNSPEQKEQALEFIKELDSQQIWPDPIVTEVAPLDVFYPAEDYHYDYFRRNPAQPYCQVVIAPKVAAFRQRFAGKLKAL